MKYLLLIFSLMLFTLYGYANHAKYVQAADRCSSNQVYSLNYQLPFAKTLNSLQRGQALSELPELFETFAASRGETIMMESAVGNELSPRNRSVHYYPDNQTGKCAIIFSKSNNEYIYWGYEMLGEHAARLPDGSSGKRTFIPSSENDANNGYIAYILNITSDDTTRDVFVSKYEAGRPAW